jgi:P2-related tail formation protein
MDSRLVIASGIADNELAKAFSRLVSERWDNFDLTPFMVYLVDSCTASALPYLAEQFDVAGLQGFEIAENEEQQRELIKRSIALHKFIGTPWAIREACRIAGFPVIILEEGVAEGTPDIDWAKFRVYIQPDDGRAIVAEETRKLRLFVEFYKIERSHLLELGFWQAFADAYVFEEDAEKREQLNILITHLAPYSFGYSDGYCRQILHAYGNGYSGAYNK